MKKQRSILDRSSLKPRHYIFLTLLAMIVAWGLFHAYFVKRLNAEGTANPFFPHLVGQSAWFQTVKSGLTTHLLEADATPFLSETGVIQIAVVRTSGSATAGTITVYTQVAPTDTVYTPIASATYPLTATASKVSDRIYVGPGYHKLVVNSAAGTFVFALNVKDF
ncbi:MAG: hypothetical protein Q8Q12_21610 [bacterium]|nr:hypothetical protein [bacterium]